MSSKLKIFLKWAFFVFLGLLLCVVLIGYFYHEPLPKGTPGVEADRMAQQMENALNKTAWDSTKWISWTFSERHSYVWDKDRSYVQVYWKDKEVLIDITTQKGKAWKAGQRLQGESERNLVKEAWGYFCNDSFWLYAPYKTLDEGASRAVVELDNGEKGLLVTYGAGGVTPGDSYLWLFDEKGLPKAWQMWVNIIPVGGVKATWEDWTQLYLGNKIALSHKIGPLNVKISGLKAGASYQTLGFSTDPFYRLFH